MTRQKRGWLGSRVANPPVINGAITTTMPAITAFIESHSGRSVRPTPPVAPADHQLHEQGLEDEQPEGEADGVLDQEIEPHRQTQRPDDRGGGDDPGGISRKAVDLPAKGLLPEGRDEPLVLPRERLAARQQVGDQADRAGVDGNGEPCPFMTPAIG